MAKVNTKAFTSLKKWVKEFPKKAISDKVKRDCAKTTIEMMKEFIARGSSPIGNRGRFPAYKASRERNRKGYPFNTPQFKRGSKAIRPVNLRLTGAFLASLRLVSLTANGFYVGFTDAKSKLKERGHREGAGGQPERPIIPSGNEQFNATIRNEIIRKMREALRAAIQRGV